MNKLNANNADQIFDLQGALAYASAIINTVREPLIVLYPKQIINSVNDSFYKTFKTDKQHTVGKHIYEIGNNQWNIPQLRKLLEDILNQESSFHDFEVEHHFETIGHKIMLLNARKLVIKNNDDELILLAIEDITARRALEKKSAKEKYSLSEIKRLRELSKQKDDFFSITSHELKTPVTSIKMYAQLLEKDFAQVGTAESIEMFRRMNLQIDKLTFLITDVLDATRIEAGKFQYENSWFDFNQLVAEVVSEMQFTTRRHTIEVVFAKTVYFFGDKDRLASVLTNLLSNAIKYSPAAKHIIVKTAKRKGHIIVSVQDFGIGISTANRKKIFSKFFRLHGLEEDLFGGLGLGLFICAEIVARHRGTISVDGHKGIGSVFSFSLPLPGKAPALKKTHKSIAV